MGMNRVIATLLTVLVLVGLVGAGIYEGGTVECDRGDVYELDDDCGYYNALGVWIFYRWVTPGVGGTSPWGTDARPPRGVRTTRPTYTGPRSSLTTREVRPARETRPASKPPARRTTRK